MGVCRPRALSSILIAYSIALLAIRSGKNPSTVNTNTQALAVLAFLGTAWVLAAQGGGLDVWPTILPLALLQAAAYASFIVFKTLTQRADELSLRFDANITVASVVMYVGLALYSIIPPGGSSWHRNADVLAAVVFGLPLAYALPSLLGNKKHRQVDSSELEEAVSASYLVYMRSKSPTFEEVEFVYDQDTGARCGIYVDRSSEAKTIFVAFAGSDSIVDWLRTNIAVAPEQYPYASCRQEMGQVHKGVLKAWASIRERVWSRVADLMLRYGGSGKIVLCGHSLGGALATIAAPDLWCSSEPQYQKSMTVITFGSPRVGDANFRREYESMIPTSVRVTAIYDPVPKIVINDFVHVNEEYIVSAGSHNLGQYQRAIQKSDS